MEVTLQLDDQVAQAVQQRAADLGVTVAAQLEQTVREVYLPATQTRQASSKRGKLPSHGHGGLRPGVNLDNSRERERITKLHTTGQGGLQPGIDLDHMAATLDILDEYDAAH